MNSGSAIASENLPRLVRVLEVVLATLIVAFIVGGVIMYGEFQTLKTRLKDHLEPAGEAETTTSPDPIEITDDTKIYTWRSGEDEVEMLRIDDGICYLTMVTGYFHDMYADEVWVRPKGERWFLGGRSKNHGNAAEAMCWRFPNGG